MNKVPESIRKELAALAAKPESEIDFSEAVVESSLRPKPAIKPAKP